MMRILFILFLLLSGATVKAQKQALPAVSYRNTEHAMLLSTNVGDSFQVYISLPEGYKPDSTKRYAVIYLTDADYSFGMTKDIANYLSWGNKIPEHILVGIAYGGSQAIWGQKRQRDFLPIANKDIYLSGGAPKFAAFLQQELIPFIDNRYKTKTADRALIGMSYGGVFASYMLLQHPGLFKRYIIGTTPFGYDNKVLFNYEEQFAKANKDMDARVYASVGGAENYFFKDFDSFTKKLQDRGYKSLKFKAEVLPDEVHESVGGGTLARGLRWIYDGYATEDKKVMPIKGSMAKLYEGRYIFQNNIVIVTAKEDYLVIKEEKGGPELEIIAESETRFFSKTQPMEFEFHKDKGKITGFSVLGQKAMEFKRVEESKGKK